jgi:hypothetical protein
MTSVQSMGSRGNTLSGPDLNRMVWLSVLTGLWSRASSPCFTRLACLCPSGVKLLLPSSMSGTGPPPLLYLARPLGNPSMAPNLMSLCCVSGAVLPMSISRRTRGTGGSLGSHMEKCIFIGYPPDYKGWKFYNPVTKKSVISERAQFDERYFLGIKESTPTIIPTSLLENPPTPTKPSQQPSSTHLESLLKTQMMSLTTLRICMIMGELVMGLILHILMSPLLIFHLHLLLPGTGLLTSQPGYLPEPPSPWNLLPLLLVLLQGLLSL